MLQNHFFGEMVLGRGCVQVELRERGELRTPPILTWNWQKWPEMAKLGQIGPNHQILLTPGNKGGGYCRVCVLIKCSGYLAQKLPVLVSDTTTTAPRL